MTKLLALALACLLHPGAAQEAPATREQLEAELDAIAAAVRTEWSYYDDHREHFGVDLDAMLAEAQAALPEVRDANDWARVLTRFAAGLQDGHAGVSVPGADRRPARRLPLRLEPCAEGLVVTVTDEEAEQDGPRPGELLVAVDGVPVEERIHVLEREQCASTPGMRRRRSISALQRVDGEQVSLTLVGSDGPEREVSVKTRPATEHLSASRPQPENWSLTWPKAGVGVLHLSSFAVPRWKEWLAAPHEEREPFVRDALLRIDAIVDELLEREARALIIDLRGNGGGTDRLGIYLAERFLRDPFRYFLLSSKLDGVTWTPPGGLTYGEGEHPRFLGRLVLLVDEGSFSTTDNFARCMDDLHPDVTVVGRPTGGGTGAPRVLIETEYTKATLRGCTQRVRGPNGELTEGRGTLPDVRVTWTREDWVLERDPDLVAALRVADR